MFGAIPGLQVERLQIQVAELQEQLQEQADTAAVREQQARLDVQAAAEERFDIQLQQQQLKYERQIQVCAQPCKLAAPAGGSSCALTHVCKCWKHQQCHRHCSSVPSFDVVFVLCRSSSWQTATSLPWTPSLLAPLVQGSAAILQQRPWQAREARTAAAPAPQQQQLQRQQRLPLPHQILLLQAAWVGCMAAWDLPVLLWRRR